jgi:formylglycine-generating enzyme required for sulfatase activity
MLTRELVPEHQTGLLALRQSLQHHEPTGQGLAELCAIAVLHDDPWVRDVMLEALPRWYSANSAEVAEAIAWAAHDTDDFVAFRAIMLAATLKLTSVLPDLLMIVGRASQRLLRHAGKPVGIGHALVLQAVIAAAGTADPERLADIEQELFRGDYELPENFGDSRDITPATACSDHRDMIRIPSGDVTFQVPPHLPEDTLVFDWDDVADPWTTNIEPFWIDKYPVTADAYDQFAASDLAHTHSCCHPDEPANKLHVRNTLLDARFHGDTPATGVDWFDAYAYAQAHGKRLPTEGEWQRAAQGDDLRAFPWGNEFDPKKARWVGEVIGYSPPSIESWRDQLVHLVPDRKRPLATPVIASGAQGPYGVAGMAGNAWEWTCTNFYSRMQLDPAARERDAVELLYDWQSYPVIRGGSWSSLPELLSVAFRGRDLLTDRHFENGFRCVAD